MIITPNKLGPVVSAGTVCEWLTAAKPAKKDTLPEKLAYANRLVGWNFSGFTAINNVWYAVFESTCDKQRVLLTQIKYAPEEAFCVLNAKEACFSEDIPVTLFNYK